MEFLIQLIAELVFQAIFEILGAVFDNALKLSEGTRSVLLKVLLYGFLGWGSGYLSFILVPETLTGRPPSVLLSFFLLPVAVGAIGLVFARWGQRRWNRSIAGSNFFYSYLLAFSFSATRYVLLVR